MYRPFLIGCTVSEQVEEKNQPFDSGSPEKWPLDGVYVFFICVSIYIFC